MGAKVAVTKEVISEIDSLQTSACGFNIDNYPKDSLGATEDFCGMMVQATATKNQIGVVLVYSSLGGLFMMGYSCWFIRESISVRGVESEWGWAAGEDHEQK